MHAVTFVTHHRILLTLLLYVAVCGPAAGQQLSEDKAVKIEQVVARFRKESGAPGLSVAVATDNTLRYAQG